MPFFEDITVEYDPGTTTAVTMHDGSKLYLKKVAEDYNPTDKLAAMRLMHETARARRVRRPASSTSSPTRTTSSPSSTSSTTPLATLPLERVRPGRDVLDAVMEEHR